MDLKDILAISGQPGLYKFIAQSSRGVIVEALTDNKRTNVPPTARVSSMGEIAIFTDAEDLPIEKVFQAIFRSTEGKEAISHKASTEELKAFFEKVLPDYDRDRVHVSDMKKVVAWYNLLQSKGLIDLEEPKTEKAESEDDSAEKRAEKKPAADKKAVTVNKPKSAPTPKAAGSKAVAPKITRGKKG